MVRALMATVAAVAMTGTIAAQHETHSQHAGATAISTLTQEQVDGYRRGEGMGMARAAELNHYPGPRHVIELASDLELTTDQLASAEAIRTRMSAEAQRLGGIIIDKEMALHQVFADGRAGIEVVRSLTSEIAALEGQLRATHLAAHLEMVQVLTPAQVRKYDELRGYARQ